MVSEALLWKYYNDYGYTDLWLQYCHINEDGDIVFTKRVKYETLMHLEDYDYIPSVGMNKINFLAKANHRSILDIELIIDIDDAEPYNSTLEKAKAIMQELRAKRIKNVKCYSTGSKGYHIHVVAKELVRYRGNYNKLVEVKRKILKWLKADVLKSSHRTGIAIEGVVHYKSGKIKKEVKL